MDPKSQQDIYNVLLGTANATDTATKEILEKLKEMLSKVLNTTYANNAQLRKAAVSDPHLVTNAPEELRPIVENINKIQNEVAATNNEMTQLRAKVDMLHGQDKNSSPEIQKAMAQELSKELNHLGELNATYTQGLKALKTSVFTLGKLDLAATVTNPDEAKALNDKLQSIYGEANALKLQATHKNKVINTIETKVEESSQKRFGK